jgi:hypothetical protein
VTHQRAIDATQKALAVMTALMDGTEGGNWDAAQSVVTDYTSDDAGTADLMAGFINLGMLLVKEIELVADQTTESVLQNTSQAVARMGDDGY